MTYGYSEGEYPNESERSERQELFTEGGWKATAIPGLLGEWEPHKPWHYLVSVGFEGIKTRQLVSQSEPDKVSLLFPDPPVKNDYEKRTLENNQRLIDQFQISKDRIVRAHAANVVEALKVLEERSIENFKEENCMYVCCGTKPHSLAFAIRAMVTGEPPVMYIVPESHRVSQVKSNGIFWRYTVKDRSAIRSKVDGRK